jgi:hypothetical protein
MPIFSVVREDAWGVWIGLKKKDGRMSRKIRSKCVHRAASLDVESRHHVCEE